MAAPALAATHAFDALKARIISLATALYGTTTTPQCTFDVLPFSAPRRTPGGTALNAYTHGAALIYYTGPASAPYVSWEMLSYVDGQATVNAGAQQLLDDMQKGVGDVIGDLVKSGDWGVRHETVPDVANGERGEGDEGGGENGYEGGGGGERRWSQSLGDIEEAEEEDHRGRGR
ncbi:hypothetical protein C7974DRAFT_450589 [Boeremia exigua]|uniref:uncharacterized protein n=1 Tax=Boeremia exigua TaxID=749465 RepID=UPI001E8E5AA3|nr:uncharacterized protein C7974DRAFT_450589 [Boeremia exigua]KAH6637619.1 hypothetical protein C7974DRAFT_450589 [Boeremia exigua]